MLENNSAVRTSPPTALLKKTYLVSILPESPPTSQSQRYKRLIQAVHEGGLTKSLEILTESGIDGDFEGDLARFIIINAQWEATA